MTPDTVKHTEANKGPKGSAAGADARRSGPPAPGLTAAIIVLVLLIAFGGWLLYGALNRPLTTPADPSELAALDAQLVKIQKTAVPIAEAFATQSATTPIDIEAYRTRVKALRDLVDSTNDLAATSPDALEIRDLVLTGGAEVVAGMQLALDAAAANDASATAAAAQMDEGLANLTAARTKLDLLLGRLKPA